MERIRLNVKSKKMLADTFTPVGIYLRMRDIFPNSILLESSDYHGSENSYSFICMKPMAGFRVERNGITETFPGGKVQITQIEGGISVVESLDEFIKKFYTGTKEEKNINGLFGYCSYDSVKFMEDIKFTKEAKVEYYIPEINYNLYKYIIAINHYNDELQITENCLEGEQGNTGYIENLLLNKNFAQYHFKADGEETSNITDGEYIEMVRKGKESCRRGDVFQIVLSRQFKQGYRGDDFNVYRTLRSINPSPYLYYFDYGNYRIFGSSPESQIIISSGKVTLTPIAGSIRRSGTDEEDRRLEEILINDAKENSEHVMLVDLARNDISRNADNVKVEVYREVQYYSHILHLVSRVSGDLREGTNIIKVMGDTFPAGTLSGAPKYKAMQLIDEYENQNRGYYGGSIGYIGFDGSINQAIMIRSFLSKNNTLYYQAGAGIIIESKEENELNEVNSKLMALKNAINRAEGI